MARIIAKIISKTEKAVKVEVISIAKKWIVFAGEWQEHRSNAKPELCTRKQIQWLPLSQVNVVGERDDGRVDMDVADWLNEKYDFCYDVTLNLYGCTDDKCDKLRVPQHLRAPDERTLVETI